MAEYMHSLERDTLSRNRIVSEMDENFFVEAGAGSGKTTMLVSRMAAMVESGIDISKICAITFTKAAAGEFYDRFQKLLIERSGPAPDQEGILSDHPSEPAKAPGSPRSEGGGGYAAAQEGRADAACAGSPRTAHGMERAGSLPRPSDLTRERCRTALQNIDLCFMGTIDSFCGMVLSEHPSEAGIPSDAKIVSDEDAAVIYKQQYVKISAGECGEELKSFAKTFQALHRGAQDIFVQGISFIMNNRNVRFHFHEAAPVDIDKDFEEDRKELLRAVKCLADHPELKYEGNKGSREAWERISDTYHAVRRRWSANYPNLLYALKSLKDIRVVPEAVDRYAASLGSVFVPGGKGKKPKWYEFAQGEGGGLYDRLVEIRYDASMTFLMKCVPVMERAMRERGSLTFFDYLYYLRNMLKKDAEGDGRLIRYIYGRHSYFLIDEFQDTNPLQAEVFFYLAAERPVPQWSRCAPRKGSLFIVGDPKQSIYRFRGADVTSFLKVKKLFEASGGAILSLSRNFRSTRQICEYFNHVFGELLPEETENQSRFEEIPLPEETENRSCFGEEPLPEEKENQSRFDEELLPEEAERPGGRAAVGGSEGSAGLPSATEFRGIYTYRAYVGRAAGEHPDMADPVRIADIIERLVGSSRFRIRGGKDGGPRPIRYGDFMVITYGKKKLGPIMAELDSRDIPTRVEGDIPFAENEALREICSIFSAVADAEDALALYGALTGKLIALTKEDILQYRANGGAVSLKAAFKAEGSTDAAALKIEGLKALYAAAGRLSPAALFSRIMDDFRVYQAAPSENLEVVYYALELLRSAEKSGLVVSHKDGAAYLNGLISGASGEERCLSLDADRDCVHMANLHKVKGLEAPIVILAAASANSFSATYRMQHGDDGSEGWLFSLESERDEDGRSTVYFQTADYPEEKAAEGEALAAEGRRLIYVAATRARNALILCNSIRISRDKETPNSKWGPIMEPGLPEIFDLIPDAPEQGEEAGGSIDASGPGGLARDLPLFCEKDEISADASELYKAARESSVLNDRSAENASYMAENPSRLHVLSKLSESQDQPEQEYAPGGGEGPSGDEIGAASGARRFPALLGTMTHKLMEMLVMSGNQLDVRAAVGEIIREYRSPGAEVCEGGLAEALQKVADTMRAGGYAQTNGLVQDMLGTLLSADEVYCEMPFSYMDETGDVRTVWNGVMDVVYLKEGRWHIVDYKTNADGSDLDLRYQGQLAAYVKAFKATTGLEADAMTYHIDI